MATRTISTKLAVEGESEYRSSISRINGEIKTLQSTLKLTESEFQLNANSMEALTAKGDALNKLYTAQSDKVKELQKALDNARNSEKAYADRKQELTDKIEANNRALDELDPKVAAAGKTWANQAKIVSDCEAKLEELCKTSGETGEEQDALRKKIEDAKNKIAEIEKEYGDAAISAGEFIAENKKLDAELKTNEQYLTAAQKGVTNWKGKLNNATIQLNDTNAKVKLNKQYMKEAENSADGCATSIDRFGNAVKESAEKSTDLRDALAAAGVIEALKKTADALMACVDASMEFESAMAGVSKTTDLSGAELAAMGDEIQDLATKIPATAVEIANVAEAAGHLGIAKEDLLDFSEVMINLGTSTNLSSEEAASALAKFANVVDMSADDYERLGSTIVGLGNNFATTEADIVSMATRLASTGEIVGLTEPQIMGIATALSSVGIEAEAGGSAISKLLKQFETMVATGSPALENFAAVAGMSAEEFAVAWGNDAVGALSAFIDGLGAVDAAGGSSAAVLDELGIKEVRLSNAVLSLASSNGILTKAMNTANNAWTENTALAKEAATRYETTESKLQMLANSAENVKIAVGDQLTPAIGELAETGVDVLNWVADFIEKNDAIIPVLSGVVAAVGAFSAAATVMAVAASGAGTALAAAASAALANPFVLAATAVAGLGAAIAILSADTGELTEAADKLNATMEESGTACDTTVENTMAAASVAEHYIGRLRELEATGRKTDDQQQEYHNILGLLCQTVPELAGYIDLQNDTIQGGTDALLANTEAWKNNALAQAYQEELTELQRQHADVLIEKEKNYIGLQKATDNAKAAEERYNEAVARSEEVMADAYVEQQRIYEQTGELVDAYELAGEEQENLSAEMEQARQEMENAQFAAENYQAAIDADKEAIAAAEEEIALANEAVENLTAAQEENTQATGDNAAAQENLIYAQQEVRTQIEELAQAYKDAYDAALASMEGQFGLFDKASLKSETYLGATVKNAQEALDSQLAYWNSYSANIEILQGTTAEQLGITQESYDTLMTYIADGSEEAAGLAASMVESINSGNTEAVADLANTATEVATKRQEIADATAVWVTNFENSITAIEEAAKNADFSGLTEAYEAAFANVGVDFYSIGKSAGENLSRGTADSSSAVADSAAVMGEGAIEATKAPIEENAAGVGEKLGDDVTAGIESATPDVESAASEMGESVTEIMTDSAKESVNDFIKDFSKISGRTQTELTRLKQTVKNTTSALPDDMSGVGREMVNGMIRGINNRSSALYSTIRSVVNSAIRAARKAAAVASPSKKTTEIFEFVGDGMVVGLENRRKKIKDTAQSVVNDALDLDVSSDISSAINSIDARIPLELESAVMRSAAAAVPTSSVAHNYGGFQIHIYQQPGENAEDLAYRVMDIMQTEIEQKEAAL